MYDVRFAICDVRFTICDLRDGDANSPSVAEGVPEGRGSFARTPAGCDMLPHPPYPTKPCSPKGLQYHNQLCRPCGTFGSWYAA